MYIAIDCYPGCDVMNFDINLIFLIKPVRDMIRTYSQPRKCFRRNEKDFAQFFKGFLWVKYDKLAEKTSNAEE